MLTCCFCFFITIDSQVEINTMKRSIPAIFNRVRTIVTFKYYFKTGRKPCFEQPDISLYVNFSFKTMVFAPSISSNYFSFFKITLVALAHLDSASSISTCKGVSVPVKKIVLKKVFTKMKFQ